MIDLPSETDIGEWLCARPYVRFPWLEFDAGCQAPDALGSSAPVILSHDATSTPGRQHDNP
jgi:hypothetical protein